MSPFSVSEVLSIWSYFLFPFRFSLQFKQAAKLQMERRILSMILGVMSAFVQYTGRKAYNGDWGSIGRFN